VQRFLACGDYRRGIARIKCRNPDCGLEYFRPFSCSVFHSLVGPPHRLCPSCSQKRTLLLGEYMNEQLLLRLPHRQFVFTLPGVLRVFFHHDKRLHGEISRLIYGLVSDFVTEAAGRPLGTAGILVFQSSGSFYRFHPHWHGLFLEGGFDHEDRFVHVPKVDLQKMSCCFRQRVIAFVLERKILNERLARNILDGTHGGFSVDDSIRIQAGSAKTREALAQYIVRPPVSLQNLLVDEGGTDTVIYRAPYSDFFKPELSLSARQSRAAWARLIRKVYNANPLICSRCHSPMKVIAVITDPALVLKVLMHLVKTGKPPRSGSHPPSLIAPLPLPGGSLSPRLRRNASAPAGGGP